MNESPAAPAFRPRNAAILTTGILLGLAGLSLCGTGVLTLLQTLAISQLDKLDPKAASELAGMKEMMESLVLVNLLLYGGLGLVFLFAAFGCLAFRRWARPLALTLGWGWLYTGVVMMLSLTFTMGSMRQMMTRSVATALENQPGTPPAPSIESMEGVFTVFLVVYYAILLVFFVFLPALLVWLNWSDEVRQTLESRDPVPRWTDGRPVPLVGMTIASVFFAVMTLPGLLMMRQPWMESFLPPGPFKYLWFLIPLFWAYVAWGSYRRQIGAWIVALLGLVGGSVSGLLSMRDVDWGKIYRQMGMPEAQIGDLAEMMNRLFVPSKMGLLMAVALLPMLGFLIWVLREFRGKVT